MRKQLKLLGCALAGLGAVASAPVSAAPTAKVGGLLQFDGVYYYGDDDKGPYHHSAIARRADFYVKGELDNNWGYKLAYSMDRNDKNASWLSYNGFDYGWIAVGLITPPGGLDHWTSSSSLTFLERASVAEAFAPGDALGIYVEGYNGMLGYSAALYLPDEDLSISGNDPLGYSARVTYAPRNQAGDVLHFGGTFRYENMDGAHVWPVGATPLNAVSLNAGPGVHSRLAGSVLPASDGTPYTASSVRRLGGSGDEAEYLFTWGLEVAAVMGPWHAQAEYAGYHVEGDTGTSDLDFDGFYIQAGYFLTGETRPYHAATGTFDNVHPNSTKGAWEIALRYGFVDLSDRSTDFSTGFVSPWPGGFPGEQHDWSLVLNWYATDNVKFQLNYNYADADYTSYINGEGHSDTTLQSLGLRAQVWF